MLFWKSENPILVSFQGFLKKVGPAEKSDLFIGRRFTPNPLKGALLDYSQLKPPSGGWG